jgi:putative phosphoesterase
MRVGIVSDIHCSLYGLDQALAAMDDVEEVLCLGDSINSARFSNDVVARLRERGALVILGNHDETFLSPDNEEIRARNTINPDLMAWLGAQPLRRTLDPGGKRLLMVHSTPWEPRGAYVFPHSEELDRFAEADADIVLYGHTHARLARPVGRVLVINPGSAGEARYGGRDWHLSCAVLDTVTEEVEMLDFPDPRFAEPV